MSLALVLGGVRSGKSAHAERLAAALAGDGGAIRYLASADPADTSMVERIAAHRARRPAAWETVLAGPELAAALVGDGVTLLDGLGTWIAQTLHRSGTEAVSAGVRALLAHAERAELVVVAEHAGEGMLPLDAVSRAWLDALGEATGALSAAADRVDYVVAGRILPLPRAPAGEPSPRREASRPADGGDPATAGLRVHGDRELYDAPGLRDHAVNVLAGGPPRWLQAALRTALQDDLVRYPDERAALLAIADRHGRDPAEAVLTNGAAEALWLLPAALRPRHAAVVHPGFTETEAALRAHAVPVTRVLRRPADGFRLRPEAVPDDADLVVVGHPASPSGTLDPPEAIAALAAPGRTVVLDEAFMAMVPGEPGSFAAGPAAPGTIVVRSLTKLLAVPGLRVGYLLAPATIADRLRAVRPPWSTNALALAAILAAAAHPAELAAAAERAAAEGADLAARLARVPGLRTWPTATNFALVEVADGVAVHAALRARGFAVRPAGSFPGLDGRHLRLTARTPPENAELLTALAELTR